MCLAVVIQHELEALKMHMKACCRARGLDYTHPNVKELTAAIVEKAETFKSMTKVAALCSAGATL